MTALVNLSIARGRRQVHGLAAPVCVPAAITLIRLNPIGACGVGLVANADQGFTVGTGSRRVAPAKAPVDSLMLADGVAGSF